MPKNEASKTASEPRLITTLTDHPISPQVRQVLVSQTHPIRACKM